jgi:hypothetical protein
MKSPNENAPTGQSRRAENTIRGGLPKHSTIIKGLLKKLDTELVIIELAAWSAFHGDRLPKADLARTLLAIRRFEGLRGTINARIK